MKNGGDITSGSTSSLALFLQSLVNEGRPAVSPNPPDPDDDDALALLAQMDALARAAYALELPPFSPETALWAARLFYQLCRFVVCRNIGPDQIESACALPCPEARLPGTDWSADLTLHHLPALFQLARHLSNADPLVGQLKTIGASWPLSSVGIPNLETLHLDSFIGHRALRRIYADRIITAGDTSRLGDLRIDDLLRGDLGVHRDLAPVIAGKLFETHDIH